MTEQQTAPDVPRWLVNQWDHERRRLETASAELDRIDRGLADPALATVTEDLAAAEQRVAQLRNAKIIADDLHKMREAKSRELDRIKENVEDLRFAAENLCKRRGIEMPDRPAEPALSDTAANPVHAEAPPFNLVDGRGAVARPDIQPGLSEPLPAPPPAPTTPDGPNGGDPVTGRFQPGRGDRRA